MIKKIKSSLHIVLLIVITIMLVASFYLKIFFANESIEELMFYLTNGAGNADLSVFFSALKVCLPFITVLMFIFIALFYNILVNKKLIIKIKFLKFREKKLQLYPIEFLKKHKIIFTTIIFILFLGISFNNIKGFEYAKNNLSNSDFIEENYVHINNKSVKLNKKRNLIFIVVESLETTFFTKDQGGDWEYEVMPELYQLLQDKDATYFASDNKSAGMYNLNGSTWTTASLISNTSGLPFKIPIDGNEYHSTNFMNGAYTLGDVLKEKGYYNEIISGAVTSFGGVKEYFLRHGEFNIIDIDTLNDNELLIKSENKSPWGFNDNYLFNTSMKRLEKISNTNQPFCLTLVTIDTHHMDGFVGNYTLNKYPTQYENVYATTSMLISDFVKWVRKQEFYKDTTIVIVGDHPSMQTEYFVKNELSKRLRYNVILNSVAKTKNTKNRVFTSVDMYPTILAAMGAEIKDDQLALGVNLFSKKKTLSEKYGFDKFNDEMAKKSLFYNKYILGDDYQEMIKKSEKDEGVVE